MVDYGFLSLILLSPVAGIGIVFCFSPLNRDTAQCHEQLIYPVGRILRQKCSYGDLHTKVCSLLF